MIRAVDKLGYPRPAPLEPHRPRRRRWPLWVGGVLALGLVVVGVRLLAGPGPDGGTTADDGDDRAVAAIADLLQDLAIEEVEDGAAEGARFWFRAPDGVDPAAVALQVGARLTVARPQAEGAPRYVTIAEVVEAPRVRGGRVGAQSDPDREEMRPQVGDRVSYLWADPERSDEKPELTLDALRGPQ